MKTLSASTAAAAMALTVAQAPVASANDQRINSPDGRVQAGALTCTIAPGTGFIIGSSKALTCEFDNKATGEKSAYTGKFDTVGLDIGRTGEQTLAWLVFGPEGPSPELLTGTYRGVSAEGALGLSFGANAMLGGRGNTVVLQPFSGQVGTGLNLSVGVSSMELQLQN